MIKNGGGNNSLGAKTRDLCEELYRAFEKPIYAYLVRRGLSVHDAEDELSGIFIRAARSLRRYNLEQTDPRSKGLLYTIANGLCIDAIRRAHARPNQVAISHVEMILDAGSDPFRDAESRAAWELVHEHLSEEDAEILRLHYVLQLTCREIAEVTKVMAGRPKRPRLKRTLQGVTERSDFRRHLSEGTVRQRMHRSLGALRPFFEDIR